MSVSVQEVRLLSELAQRIAMSPRALTRASGMPIASAYTGLRRLALKGMVTRIHAPRPGAPTAVKFRITRKGIAARRRFAKLVGLHTEV